MRLTTFTIISIACVGASAHAQTYKQIYSFPGHLHGSAPYAGLTEYHGKLFGTTVDGGSKNCYEGCGTVFSVDPKTGKVKVIYLFQGDNGGASPTGNLLIVRDLLYGTTEVGGSAEAGTVFSLDPHTHVQKVVYSFMGGADGDDPYSELLNFNGKLYGTTLLGASTNDGTVFSVDPATGAEKVVFAFLRKTDGSPPWAGLTQYNGLLYGTTAAGAKHNDGTVYSIDPATGTETVVHTFGLYEGGGSESTLLRVGDKLYGTTSGGLGGVGTVFWFKPATGALKTVYSFQGGSDGATPYAGLIEMHGVLYGTTYSGGGAANCGSSGCGTVFAIDLSTGVETVVYAFQGGSDGSAPRAGLTASQETLFGTTERGGTADSGTVFKVTP